ncbi:NUDIX domain-containing protein [Corynebacterium callunae]|uniref:NUDIX domain-containing protein n=1 Tax=Corynebacterium callunae TaxID=1721 RepID=UPI003982C09C
MRILPIGPGDEIAVLNGAAVFVEKHPGEVVPVAPDLGAVRVSLAEIEALGQARAPREIRDRDVAACVSILRNRELVRFDPFDGSELSYHEPGVAYGASGRPHFPRLDPAVIGLVELRGEDRLLLGMNAARRIRYSLIAGYVSHGESIEEAFAREVFEEAARRVTEISYVASQPWPVSGSLMLGMRGVTEDELPQGETDGELAQTIWASPLEIIDNKIPLAPPGSIAHDMIHAWARSKQS